MTLDLKIETIHGNLRDTYKQCVPGTMLNSSQIMNARRTNPELRSQWFDTSDGMVYTIYNDHPILMITSELTNPILKNIDEAFNQLTTTREGYYTISPADFKAVQNDPNTLTIDLTKLNIHTNGNNPWGSVNIPTTRCNQLNLEERKLAQHMYGQGNDFILNMDMLRKAGIGRTRIEVLKPQYVNSQEGPIARSSFISVFVCESDCNAGGLGLIHDMGHILGIRKQ